MSYIPKLKLSNGCSISATYDHEFKTLHVCEIPEEKKVNLKKCVIKNKSDIIQKLEGHKVKVDLFVIYSSSGIECLDYYGNVVKGREVLYVNSYKKYAYDRLRRLLR